MLTTKELLNLFLPNLRHWQVWLVFLIVAAVVLLIYSYPYIRKPKKEFHYQYIGTLIPCLVSLYIFTKLFEGVVYKGSIIKIDLWFQQFVNSLHTPFWTSVAVFFSTVGGTRIASILIVITIGSLFLMKRWRFAFLSIVALSGSTLFQTIFKTLVNRDRPLDTLEIIAPGNFAASFPSGHAITAIIYVSLLVYSYKNDIKHLATKYALIIAVSAFFIIIGLSRIYLNAHWFSDVIAGMSLGIFWFMSLILVVRCIEGLAPAIKKETKKVQPKIPKK
jgi:membrane-associated phospholipid phosphatase